MHVAGGDHRLLKLFSQFYDFFVQLDQIFVGIDSVVLLVSEHKRVVSQRLNLQIIIEIHQPGDLLLRSVAQQCLIKLSRLAGAADQQSVPVLQKNALRHPWPSSVIFQMGLAHQLVEIDPARLVSCKYNRMIRGQFLDRIYGDASVPVQLVHVKNVPFSQHFHELHKNLRRTRRVVHRPVVMVKRDSHCFCHRIQLEPVQRRQEESGHSYGVHIGEFLRKPLSFAVFDNKTHIKIRVVSHQYRVFAEFHKFRQHGMNVRSVHDHRIINAGKLFDPVGNGNLRIYKSGKTVRDGAVFHFHRANLDDLAGQRRKSCGLDIKHHKLPVHGLPFTVGDDPLQIVHQICFHPIKHFKIGFLRNTSAPCVETVVCFREGLHYAVIRDGDRLVPPLVRPLHQGFCVGNAVHIAHFRMTVKLHSLLRAGVHSGRCEIRDFFDPGHRSHCQLAVKTVNRCHAFQF